ncbi:MAG: hypothetical protein HeimC3_29870 [Candidatus Heimdallarchaeota archaeon LC_3]|nr:MAG: hypothetical protein HeimC3_29870 [Candidatus Heimdallarchaeota archaeon LC_3]
MNQEQHLQTNKDPLLVPTKKPDLNYSIKDKYLVFKTEIDAMRAETKAVLRKLFREAKYLWRGMDLVLLFILLAIVIIAAFLLSVVIIPLILSLFPGSVFKEAFIFNDNGSWKLNKFSIQMLNIWLNDTTLRIGVGGLGALGIAFRLLMKRDIEKFRDKVKHRGEVTYVFGSTIYAERFCHQMVHEYGYEEYIALISDQDYLWVQNIAGLLDTYTMKNSSEFDKENFYTMLEFKNAKRIMLMSDNVERNQAILTNIRAVRPDVPIYILSQYTPAFLQSKLVEDENIHIIDDLNATNKGLVTSLSLDIVYPDCTEINVPRTYVGRSGEYLTKDVLGIEVLAIRRPDIDVEEGSWKILPPTVKLQRTDRILCYVTTDFSMKKMNRIATELPVHPLVHLGHLNVDGVKNKITDLPSRAIYFEPMGSRRSWRRVFLVLFGLLSIITSIVIGRLNITSINDSLNNVDLFIAWDVIFFFIGVILLLSAYWLHPISERGIRIVSKDEKNYIIKTRSFSKWGADTTYNLNKMVEIYCLLDRLSGERQYYFQFKDRKLLPFIKIYPDKKNKESFELTKNRFEKRLQSYTGKQINIIEDMNQVKEIKEEHYLKDEPNPVPEISEPKSEPEPEIEGED